MPAAVDGERETPFAFARLGETGDDAQQGCLPTTGRPENTQEFARAEIEIDCLKRRQSRAETLADTAQSDDRVRIARLRQRAGRCRCRQGRIPTFLSTNCSVYALRKSRSLG